MLNEMSLQYVLYREKKARIYGKRQESWKEKNKYM